MEIKKILKLRQLGTKQVYETFYYEGEKPRNIEEYMEKVYKYTITLQDLSKKINKRLFLIINLPTYLFGRANKEFIKKLYNLLLEKKFWENFETLADYEFKRITLPKKLNKKGHCPKFEEVVGKVIDLIIEEIERLTTRTEVYDEYKGRVILQTERKSMPVNEKERLFNGKIKIGVNDKEVIIEI